jgi:hypothetical protein
MKEMRLRIYDHGEMELSCLALEEVYLEVEEDVVAREARLQLI